MRLERDHARQADNEEANLVIQHFDEAKGEWTPLPTTVDFNASTARAQVDSLSIFALTIKGPVLTPTPPAAEIQDPTPIRRSTAVPTFQLKVNGRPVTGASVATTNATVSVSPPPNAPNDRYITGTEVKIALSPASGFTGSCATSSIMMTSDLEVGCSVSRAAYTLSIQGQPVTGPSLTMAEGTVSLSPAPNASGNRYSHGSVVNLNLTPANGFSGFCDTLAVTMTSNRDVRCTMTQQSYVLSIQGRQVTGPSLGIPEGSVGLSPAPNASGNRYSHGTVVNLSLSPSGGFSGFCDTLAVTMTSDRDISCTMTQQSHVLSIQGRQVTGPSLTMPEGSVSLFPSSQRPGEPLQPRHNCEPEPLPGQRFRRLLRHLGCDHDFRS